MTTVLESDTAENQKTVGGYRLQTLELWNWGTFDRELVVVRPEGDTTLLVGQNGSGKSTLVDAILTLLVKPGVRNFNVAAGARKTERDERSYIRGAYDRTEDEQGHVLIKYLRPNAKGYTVILACFQTPNAEKAFTIAQLLYITSDQSVEKVYCIRDGQRSVKDDLPVEEPPDQLLKSLRQRDWRATKTFSEYEGWFLHRVRAKPKATEVLNQTVAVKDIQRLNDFIRQHMLESQPWSEKVDRLLGHFAQLREAHKDLVNVREQHDLLRPIARLGERYNQHIETVRRAQSLFEAADVFVASRALELVQPEMLRFAEERSNLGERREELELARRLVQSKIRDIENDIKTAGGARLAQLPALIEAERFQRDAKRRASDNFHGLLKRCGLWLTVTGSGEFLQCVEQVRFASTTHIISAQDIERRLERLILERGALDAHFGDLDRELKSLNQRRENLPEWCVAIRNKICATLRLSVKDLPFAAELIAVRTEVAEWESSIEKVLRSFGLSLLVPDRFYHSISAHVDRTRMQDDRGTGQRLRYLRVGGVRLGRPSADDAPDSLILKLDLRENHPLTPWVRAELLERFDYQCCETIEAFQAARGKAITRSRHVKTGERSHEKDDTEHAIDPRFFVLGWDNRQKRLRVAEELERISERVQEIQDRIVHVQDERAEIQTRLSALDELRRTLSFSEIDFQSHQRQMDVFEAERSAIETASDVIPLHRSRLAEAEREYESIEDQRDNLVREDASLEKSQADATRLRENAESTLTKYEVDGPLSRFSPAIDELALLWNDELATIADLLEKSGQVRAEQGKTVMTARSALEPVKDDLTEAMSNFMKRFPAEHDVRANVEYLPSFLGLRDRIERDDLPRHERRFKERLNERVIQEIGLFRADLEREKRVIQEKIEMLNASLRRLQYRPGTHIQLDPRAIRDVEITEFQGKLRECIEGSFDDTSEGNEARFIRIEALLERLQDESNRRWRDKVTDVRRWFDFVAIVIDRETDKTVSIYQDSSGQSGGEKAKLAFTILVAAIAYQYDLDPEHPDRERLQFVVVDEMFSKVDDQHAEFALELFREFGLQLLIVAPLDAKARVTQPYVGCYLHVTKKGNRSNIFQITAREFDETVGELASTGSAERRVQ